MVSRANDFFYKIQYLSYFVARAFLLAIFGILILLAFVFTVYFVDLFFNVKTGNYNSPLFDGYVVVSQSMVPTINVNDAIVIKRENDDGYHIGDIISFYTTEYDRSGVVVTHRIIDKKNFSSTSSDYQTKGDNNPVPDRTKVTTSNIYGKVFIILPKLGYIQSFLSQPINFAFCILIPAVIVILYDLYRIGKAFRKTKEIY